MAGVVEVAAEYLGATRRTAVWERREDGSRHEGTPPEPTIPDPPLVPSDRGVSLRRSTLVRKQCSREVWSVLHTLSSAFLPIGYPESVTPDYLHFQFWDTLQGLSTYIRSMLSTQVLLGGLGVGQNSATALGATFQWFVRDFTGMLGGIIFTLLKGSNLDSNAKQWRLAADVINDVGMLLDLVSPLYPPAFLPVLCLGSISRAITGTASGATRAALTQHFSLQQNAADISAKEGSQETVATMVGMLLGIFLVRLIAGRIVVLWGVFLSLTAFHVFANYMAVGSLCLTSLNRSRTLLLLQRYLQTGKVLTPAAMSKIERLLPEFSWFRVTAVGSTPSSKDPPASSSSTDPMSGSMMSASRVQFGCSLTALGAKCGSWDTLEASILRYGKGPYLLWRSRRGTVYVVLNSGAGAADTLKAFVHSLLLSGGAQEADAVRWMSSEYLGFVDKLQPAGWATSHVILAPQEWRATWTPDFKE